MWAVLSFAIAFRLIHFPDLTVEGSMPLGAAVFAVSVRSGLPLPLALILAMSAGAAAGALTAMLHTRFRVNPFLAGIIVVSIIYTLMLRLMGGSNVSLLNHHGLFDWLPRASAQAGRLQRIALLGSTALAGCLGILGFFATHLGVRIRAAGSNPQFCSSLAVRPGPHIVLGLAGSNALAALSGAYAASHQAFADVGSGQGIMLVALAALAIGEAIVPRRRLGFPAFILLSGVCGAIVYYTVVSVAIQAGLAASDLRLATGCMVLVVVAVRAQRDGEYQPRDGLA